MTQIDKITARIEGAARNGKSILILGWMPKNHDDNTRALEEAGTVRFLGSQSVPRSISSGSLVVVTRFTPHTLYGRLKGNGATVISGVFEINQIKQMLSGLYPKPPEREEVMAEETEKEGPRENREAQFCKEVLAGPLHGDSGGTVTSHQLRELLTKYFGDDSRASQFDHLLGPVRKEGHKKSHTFRLTPRALELAGAPMVEEVEPTDPAQKVRWLLSREPGLREREKELYEEIQRIDEELKRIEKLKEVLKQV